MKRKRLWVLIACLAMAWGAYAQNTSISGTVTDQNNEPIIGATVIVVGTSSGTTTDINGRYAIQAPANATLRFQFLGYDTRDVAVAGKTTIDVKLETSAITINDVVKIGYGTVRRADLTASVSSLSGAELADIPVTNVAQALAGRIAGVQVTSASGAPDADISIRVRGGMSITQDNSPLYVIDGFPADDLSGIDPSDIETIDVLKDASATAIYGSRGANGIVLVTTKKGKAGRVTVNYDMYYGFKQITKTIDLLSGADFVYFDYERSLGLAPEWFTLHTETYGPYSDIEANFGDRPGIDWQKEVFGRRAITQSHKASVSGGDDRSSFNISYTRSDEDGIMFGSGLTKDAIRFRYDLQANDRLRVSTLANYVDQSVRGLFSLEDAGRNGVLRATLLYRPLGGKNITDEEFMELRQDPIRADQGDIILNPVKTLEYEHNLRRTKTLSISADVEYELTDNLVYRGMIGLRHRDYTHDQFFESDSKQAQNQNGAYGSIASSKGEQLTYNNTLTYRRTFDRVHHFDVMVGQEYTSYKTRKTSLGNKNFPEFNFGTDDMSLGVNPNTPTTDRLREWRLSYFGRANYNLRQKYLFSASLRADGSSKFGKNHEWGYFPAASAAWRLSEEDFVKNLNLFSNLKLRVSYGTTGNDRINDYLSLSLLVSGGAAQNNAISPIYYSTTIANPDLKWETNIQKNVGIDMGFLDNKIQITVDLYHMKTKDLLVNRDIPYSSGYAKLMQNVGSTVNKGIEFSLNTVNIHKKDFRWTTAFNISFNRNKVVELKYSEILAVNSGWAGSSDFSATDFLVKVGQPLGQFYGYVYDGIYGVDDFTYDSATGKWTFNPAAGSAYFPGDVSKLQPGYQKYKKTNFPDGVNPQHLSEDDRTVIGNATPKFFGGIGNTFTYKDFDLSVYMNYSYGNDIYNATRFMPVMQMNYRNGNVPAKEYYGRFVTIDEQGNLLWNNPDALRAANVGKTLPSIVGSTEPRLSDRFIEDGSFLRISNITIGYTLPRKLVSKLWISSLRIYLSVNNVHTFTSYSGYDPEVSVTLPYGSLTPGVDWGAYPRARSIIGGLNLSF